MKKNIFKVFKDFVTRGNVVDLAVGLIIGGAFTSVINSFVSDIIMPLIAMLGRIHLSQMKWVLNQATNNQSEVAIMYGNFIQVAINFFITALCIFLIIILMGRDPKKIKTKDEAQKGQAQKTNDLLEEIRDALKNK